MGQYAQRTDVSSEKSKAEIERTLRKYGADQFMYGWQEDFAVVAFRMSNRQIKFLLPMPDIQDPVFQTTPTGKARAQNAIEKEYEQAIRQKWRALALVIKAKLEAVESGIAEFEDEFMANIVMPDGGTVSQHVRPKIDEAYKTGKLPNLLPAPGK